jgi:hypothetical protein
MVEKLELILITTVMEVAGLIKPGRGWTYEDIYHRY